MDCVAELSSHFFLFSLYSIFRSFIRWSLIARVNFFALSLVWSCARLLTALSFFFYIFVRLSVSLVTCPLFPFILLLDSHCSYACLFSR